MLYLNSRFKTILYNESYNAIKRTLLSPRTPYKKSCKKRSEQPPKQEVPLFHIGEVERFVRDCALKAGCSEDNASTFAELIVMTDCMGIKTHGLNRVDMYTSKVLAGATNGKAIPEIIKESESVALINGNNGLGHIVAKYAMNVAIQKAKMHGAGMAVCTHGCHIGALGLFTLQAAECGCIGIIMTMSSSICVPFGAKDSILGTNPICIAGPGTGEDNFNIDMSTAAVALGKVEVKLKNNEPLPVGWALNADGTPATNPAEVMKKARLVPLGGSTFGHLGYGLGLMIHILTSLLAGVKSENYKKQIKDIKTPSDLQYTFIAIDPEKFHEGFKPRLSAYLNLIRDLPRVDKNVPVTVAGDIERNLLTQTSKKGVLNYPPKLIEVCGRLAKDYKVTPLQPVKKA